MVNMCVMCKAILGKGDFTGKSCPYCTADEIERIDENLALVIQRLDRLGYHVYECSSGHIFSIEPYSCTYIQFSDTITFPRLPKGFSVYPSRDGFNVPTVLAKRYRAGLSEFELQYELLKSALDLLRWVEKLPPNNWQPD